jgi:hypothetical protein
MLHPTAKEASEVIEMFLLAKVKNK